MKENEKQSRILEREKLIEEVKKLTLFDDVFMSAVLEDIPAMSACIADFDRNF